ncbi:hypothetical protein SJI19_19360 [Acerihabitans sp. TG2]|uniref:hypothetical protein n=1 Tax=Acerihabitans sp. TG2 TaxID=3096008 RepID=UPI002B233385|nr:hypothetical protein [Acerihabitans sp. TG2]MEA9392666.1 hypothetical protein [Acerihabitans sp. TG2]
MNFQGNETLRADVAQLANTMDELRQRMRELEQAYFWNSEELPARLAGQIINQVNTQFLKIYQQVNELDQAFRD